MNRLIPGACLLLFGAIVSNASQAPPPPKPKLQSRVPAKLGAIPAPRRLQKDSRSPGQRSGPDWLQPRL